MMNGKNMPNSSRVVRDALLMLSWDGSEEGACAEGDWSTAAT